MPNDCDPDNPVDMDADDWTEVYSRMDDFEDYQDYDYDMN